MGQTIEIRRHVHSGEVLIIDTDRTFSGQTSRSYTSDVEPATDDYGAMVARRIFDTDPQVDHVHVLSNAVTIRRPGGWDEDSVTTVLETVSGFFRVY